VVLGILENEMTAEQEKRQQISDEHRGKWRRYISDLTERGDGYKLDEEPLPIESVSWGKITIYSVGENVYRLPGGQLVYTRASAVRAARRLNNIYKQEMQR
jgi:hypothetical protein